MNVFLTPTARGLSYRGGGNATTEAALKS